MHRKATWVEVVPPLENGDRLSRDEFERRYDAMPEVKKAELIEGVVYMPSPTRFEVHAEPHGTLIGVFFNYRARTPGVLLGDNSTVQLDLDNEPQPDALLFIKPKLGGSARLSEDDYIEGAPELVAEVAASSVSIDLGPKKTVYRRNGVREYLVWRVRDAAVDWFVLRGTVYESLAPDDAGVIRSEVFPGLWLNVPALLDEDVRALLETLDQGLASPEHRAFVEELSRRAKSLPTNGA